MSQTLTEQLLDSQEKLEKYRKKFMEDGVIKDDEQKWLDALQAKIDKIITAMTKKGEGVINVVGAKPVKTVPPPKVPQDVGGAIRYEGVPPDKVKDKYQQNVIAMRAQRVREGMRSVDGWAQRFDEKQSVHEGQRQFYDKVIKDKMEVHQAFDKDLKSGAFRKLSRSTKGQLQTELADYEESSSQVTEKLKMLEAQAWKLAAADAMVTKAESLLKSYDLEKERDIEEKKKAEIEAKLESVKGAVAFFKDASKDPAGTAKKLGLKIANQIVDDILVEILTGGIYEKRIKEIQARIEQINEQLEKHKVAVLQADLSGALNSVTAIKTESDVVRQQLAQAKAKQGRAVDHLADLEIDHPGTTTVFREMKEYYDNAQNVGDETLRSSREYESVMHKTKGAMEYTDDIRQAVRVDQSDTWKLYQGQPTEEVLRQERHSEAIVKYTEQMDQWYTSKDVDKKIADERHLQAKLMRNEHYLFVGQMGPVILFVSRQHGH